MSKLMMELWVAGCWVFWLSVHVPIANLVFTTFNWLYDEP